MQAAPSIQKLLDELERLPGVGPKSAQRMAYWILNTDAAEALRLADAIREVKAGVHFCARCFNYAEGDLCEICASSKRDGAVICVVSEPRDIPPIERAAVFNGVYHVLGGVLAPMEGVGPGDLRIAELMARHSRDGQYVFSDVRRTFERASFNFFPVRGPKAPTESFQTESHSHDLSAPPGAVRTESLILAQDERWRRA